MTSCIMWNSSADGFSQRGNHFYSVILEVAHYFSCAIYFGVNASLKIINPTDRGVLVFLKLFVISGLHGKWIKSKIIQFNTKIRRGNKIKCIYDLNRQSIWYIWNCSPNHLIEIGCMLSSALADKNINCFASSGGEVIENIVEIDNNIIDYNLRAPQMRKFRGNSISLIFQERQIGYASLVVNVPIAGKKGQAGCSDSNKPSKNLSCGSQHVLYLYALRCRGNRQADEAAKRYSGQHANAGIPVLVSHSLALPSATVAAPARGLQ